MRGLKRRLHENWEVVDDCVTSTQLLHELGGRTEDHAAEVLGLSVGEEGRERCLSTLTTGCGDGVENDVALDDSLFVGIAEAVQGRKDAGSILSTVAGEQPTWRFRKEGNSDAENKSENNLEGDWESPGEVIKLGIRSTVIDPVGDHGTDSDDTTLDTDEETTVGGAGTLGLVGWNG